MGFPVELRDERMFGNGDGLDWDSMKSGEWHMYPELWRSEEGTLAFGPYTIVRHA